MHMIPTQENSDMRNTHDIVQNKAKEVHLGTSAANHFCSSHRCSNDCKALHLSPTKPVLSRATRLKISMSTAGKRARACAAQKCHAAASWCKSLSRPNAHELESKLNSVLATATKRANIDAGAAERASIAVPDASDSLNRIADYPVEELSLPRSHRRSGAITRRTWTLDCEEAARAHLHCDSAVLLLNFNRRARKQGIAPPLHNAAHLLYSSARLFLDFCCSSFPRSQLIGPGSRSLRFCTRSLRATTHAASAPDSSQHMQRSTEPLHAT
eukprot:1528404-Rhodomonas_salina.2